MKENLHVLPDIVLKKASQTGFQVLPYRWVIERTDAWISRNRGLVYKYERLADSSEAYLYLDMPRLGLISWLKK